ncbi:MAG: hypothetical protein VXW65_13340 [Pseudomonadota bacterium]|nr:hypothetical protein [Pseudomonadota bacterium]
MDSFFVLNAQRIECQFFYPAPLYVNCHIYQSSEIFAPAFESFEQYNAKLIVPRGVMIPLGLLQITHQARHYLFRAEDTFWRSDRAIYGTVLHSQPIGAVD